MSGVSDSDALEIWRSIDVLTAEEGDSVTINCANMDFNGQPNHAIDCNGHWTGYADRRFADDLMVNCFRKAIAAYFWAKAA